MVDSNAVTLYHQLAVELADDFRAEIVTVPRADHRAPVS